MTETTDPQQAERRDRYATAIRETDGWVLDGGQHMIDAVMAVADAERAALMQAHVALAAQAGRDQAAVARVRRLHDGLDAETDLASPDDEITRGAAARKIAAALDGYTPPAPAAAPSAPADRCPHGCDVSTCPCLACEADQAELSDAERAMLTYALDQAQERIWSEDGFTDEDQAAVTSLRRLAAASGPGGVAGEAQQPEPQADAHPPTVTWEIESPRRGTWASWGTTYDEHDWARQRFEDAIGHVPARRFRLVRATTVYAVEAEQPAAVAQPAEARQADAAGEQQ